MAFRGIASGLSAVGSLINYNMSNYIKSQRDINAQMEAQYRDQIISENIDAYRDEQRLQAERDRAMNELLQLKDKTDREARNVQTMTSPQYWISGIVEDVGETKTDIDYLKREIYRLVRMIENLESDLHSVKMQLNMEIYNPKPKPSGPLNYTPDVVPYTPAEQSYTGAMNKPSSGIPEGFWGLPNGEDFGLSNDVWDLFDSTNTP